jgi:pyruvate dehydrogenase E2 component (dihydrolipoamide acetyltransferase)
MAIKVTMPMYGLTMTEGEVTEWLKQEGDAVTKGEMLFLVMTDKATMEVEAPADGYLLKIVVPEGQTVPVGAVIGVIGEQGEDLKEILTEEAPPEDKSLSEEITVPKNDQSAVASSLATNHHFSPRILISPRAKKLALKNNISYENIIGSGEAGRITEKDILALLEKGNTKPKTVAIQEQVIPFTGIREIIATRLSQSEHENIHVYFTTKVDMSKATDLRAGLENNSLVGKSPQKISYNDLLIKTAGICLTEFPEFNSSLAGPEIRVHPSVNVGLAVAIETGLVVPVIRDVTNKSLMEIAVCSKELVNKARTGKLLPDDMAGGTFTISNLGMFGIEHFTAIINPPEAAILAVGSISKEPIVENDQIIVKPIMRVTLAVDHRLIDGAKAARFVKRCKELMEHPYLLLM